MCYLRRRFTEQFADCTGRTYIGAGLTLNSSDWESWTYTDGSCHIQDSKSIGAGVYYPSSGNSNLVSG